MAVVASLLLFLVLGGGLVGLVLYRRSLQDDDTPEQLPPDLLIALGRANDVARDKPEDDKPPLR